MARDVANVRIAGDGRGFVAAADTALPTNFMDIGSWAGGSWAELGWLSEDGLTEGQNEQYTEIRGWDGTVLRKVLTQTEKTFQFTTQETNKATAELYRSGSTMEWDAVGSRMEVKTPTSDRRAIAFFMADGDEIILAYAPDAEVSARGDLTYKNDAAAGAQITVTAYPDDNGVTVTFYYSTDYSS